jgi:endoglycosylceramidase
MEKITTFRQSFVDSRGRERIFNGVNIPDKGDDRADRSAFVHACDDAFLDKMQSLGFNLIRLGMTWETIEPEKGSFNLPYLESVKAILDRCAEREIYVFLDMHQDLYASFGRGIGDGAPKWACLSDGRLPRPAKFVWAEGYFWGKAVHKAFDNFWANTKIDEGGGVLDYFARMWQFVAGMFKDHPALFGFDILNEPFPGTDGGRVFKKIIFNLVRVTLFSGSISRSKLVSDLIHKDRRMYFLDHYTGEVLRLVTSAADELIYRFDTQKYSPFINKISKAIREKTDNGILLMENSYYSNLGIPYSAPAIHYDGEREEKIAFAPHAYDFMVDTDLYKYANNDRVGSIFAEHRRSQQRLDVPVIVGEWGGGGSGNGWFPHVMFLLDLFDRNKWSQTYWAYTEGFLESELMGVLSRPYPQAVTGTISRYAFDRGNKVFTLVYEQAREFACDTVIYLPSIPKAVEASGTHTIEKGMDGATGLLRVKSPVGKNKIKVWF